MATTIAAAERSPPKKEPRVRRDGLCTVCKKERPVVAKKNLDPFCSSPCCRAWYGTSLQGGGS